MTYIAILHDVFLAFHAQLAGFLRRVQAARLDHVVVAGNCFASLRQKLRGTPCRAYISDMQLEVVDPGLVLSGTNQRYGARGQLRILPQSKLRLRDHDFEVKEGSVRFEDPNRFDIDRELMSSLTFSIGPHICLGMHLARMEMRALFAELLPRLDSIELAGTPRNTRSNFVSGLKSLPVKYRMK